MHTSPVKSVAATANPVSLFRADQNQTEVHLQGTPKAQSNTAASHGGYYGSPLITTVLLSVCFVVIAQLLIIMRITGSESNYHC